VVQSLEDRRESLRAGAKSDARSTRMLRRTAGPTGQCEGRQRWGDVIGGIVERAVGEVFMVCDVNVGGNCAAWLRIHW